MDLQTLIDMPGAGNANKAVMKAGKWDEYVGMAERKFAVSVSGTVSVSQSYIITARHPDEADELACQKFDNEYDGDIDDVEVSEL